MGPTFVSEINTRPSSIFKTKLCERYSLNKTCPYGPRCQFAHGQRELRCSPVDAVKTTQILKKPQDSAQSMIKNPSDLIIPVSNMKISNHEDPTKQLNYQFEETGNQILPLDHKSSNNASNSLSDKSKPGYFNSKRSDSSLISNGVHDHKISTSLNLKSSPAVRSNPQVIVSLRRDMKTNHTKINKVKIAESESSSQKIIFIPKTDPSFQVTASNNTSIKDVRIDNLIEQMTRILFSDLSLKEQIKDITRMEVRNDLTKSSLYRIIINSLCNNGTEVVGEVSRRFELLKYLINSESEQLSFLIMIESVFSSKKLSNINIAILFKRLYDDDIIEEDTFFNWVERGCSQREFLTKASPFIQWLREAEEDGG